MTQCTRLSLPAVALALSLLSGCAQLMPDWQNQAEASEQITGVDRHSSFPALRRVYFEQVNLIEMIDPGRRAEAMYATAWLHDGSDGSGGKAWGRRYDLVLNWFRNDTAASALQKQAHRNSVQDKILAVATSRCNVFKTFLRRQQSDVNFLLGSATTAAGVLGAVLPGVNASRNLAGLAGLFSGVQAEFNSTYYSNLAAHVIAQGIELRQARLQRELVQARQSLGIDAYSMEAAINDAIVMDGSCSTVVGLLEAADSIKESNNPGLARAAEIMAGVRAMNEIANAETVSGLAESGQLAKLLKQASPVSSPLVVASVKPDKAAATGLQTSLAEASDAERRRQVMLTEARLNLQARFASAQAKLPEAERATANLATEVVKRYRAAVDSPIESLPIPACVQALRTPAVELGSAEATARLQPGSEAARVQAEQKLQLARANASAAVQRVQLLLGWAATEAERAAAAWAPVFSQPQLSAATLKTPPMPAVPAELKALCAPGG